MPTAYVKKIAKKHNMSVSKAENKWEEAKEKAEEQDHKEDYGYITSIFKSMMGEGLENVSFKQFLINEYAENSKPPDKIKNC